MHLFWRLCLLYALAALLIFATSCQPGTPITVSGFYRTADGSKAGLSTTFQPRITPEK